MTVNKLPPLRIAHLYPALLNVAGDGGNVMAVANRAQWRGLRTETVPVGLNETPDFTDFDMVFFQGGQDVEMLVAADDLLYKATSLKDAAEAGVIMLAVCAGMQLFGHRYVSGSGEEIPGIGVLDLETRAGDTRFMQHAACDVTVDGTTATVVGFENHSGCTTLGAAAEPFGTVVAGAGNNGTDGLEGARQQNVFGTYLHGPVLPKNPWLADVLAKIAWERKVGRSVELSPLDDSVERRAHHTALSLARQHVGQTTVLKAAQLARGLSE
ncbi:MAG: glutamine amidotransferase [Candidatus Nanopelagicales bacterium]